MNELISLTTGIGFGYSVIDSFDDRFTTETLGQNQYISIFSVFVQLSLLERNLLHLSQQSERFSYLRHLGNRFIVTFVVFLSALHKHEDYQLFAQKINHLILKTSNSTYDFLANYIPVNYLDYFPSISSFKMEEELTPLKARILSGISDHSNKLFLAATLISQAVSGILGRKSHTIGVFIYTIYAFFIYYNYIPKCCANFIDYLCLLAACLDSFLNSGMFLKTVNFVLITSVISLRFRFFYFNLIENFLSKFINLLESLEIPLNVFFKSMARKEWKEINHQTHPLSSLSQALELLKGDKKDYIPNLSVWAISLASEALDKAPKNFNFKRFLELFDQMITKDLYVTILNKVMNDERFINMVIKQEFPLFSSNNKKKIDQKEEASDEETLRGRTRDGIIEALIAKKGLNVTKEDFLLDWTKEQLKTFVNRLVGTSNQVEKNEKERYELKKIFAFILAYLELHLEEKITVQDILLRCAIEGGGFCELAFKDLGDELISQFFYNTSSNSFSDNILKSFESARKHRIERALGEAIKENPKAADIYKNRHMASYVKKMWFGIYPMSMSDMRNFTFSEFISWKTLTIKREDCYKILVEADLGLSVGFDADRFVVSHLKLSDEEKKQLGDALINEEDPRKFNTLVFACLNLLKKNPCQ